MNFSIEKYIIFVFYEDSIYLGIDFDEQMQFQYAFLIGVLWASLDKKLYFCPSFNKINLINI